MMLAEYENAIWKALPDEFDKSDVVRAIMGIPNLATNIDCARTMASAYLNRRAKWGEAEVIQRNATRFRQYRKVARRIL